MNEEYLIGLFRKAIIEAKADAMMNMGIMVMREDHSRIADLVHVVDRYENLLRDEKALRKIAKSVIEHKP